MVTADMSDSNMRDGDDSRGRAVGNNSGNNLHVSGLSYKVEDRDLDEIFSKYGKVC